MAGPNYPLGATIGTGAGPDGARGTLMLGSNAAGAAVVARMSDTGGIVLGGAVTTTAPAYSNGTSGSLSLTTVGGLRTALVDSAGAELDYTSPTLVQGPTAVSRLLSAANTTNSTLVKATAGRVFNLMGYNAAGAARYLKVYTKATAPTIGTDTPVLTLYLAASSTFTHSFPNGLYLASGIGFGLTTGSADNDTGALTAADVLALNVAYN